jgi:hypothetical protein
VEASIAGAEGTWLEHRSYHTDQNGQTDTGVLVGDPSVTEGKTTRVDFVVDTCAATLRYYYRIPEAAKGQSVSFTFSSTDNNGQTATYRMGPYPVSKMDIALDLRFRNVERYISIQDMKVYTEAEAAANPDKIDLVYVWKNYNAQGIAFAHTFSAPAADEIYRAGLALPEGMNRNTKIRKGGPKDAHLARLHLEGIAQPAIYVDDIDFIQMKFDNMPNYALNLINEDGMWVETQDGEYRAYFFFKNFGGTGNVGGYLSMKRYKMK